MNRPRLLLAIPAATALVFTGVAPAWAGEGDGHDDVSAEVISIDDEAEADDDAEYVDVSFDYKCEDDDGDDDANDFVAKVTLKQDDGDVRYEGEFDDLTCDGEKQTAEDVRLDQKSDDEVENGEAWVTVRILDEDDEVLDRLTETVDVVGVDEDDDDKDDDKDHDKDHHKDHHDGH
jgi:hypothetical protein